MCHDEPREARPYGVCDCALSALPVACVSGIADSDRTARIWPAHKYDSTAFTMMFDAKSQSRRI